jgi:hypothetical protein
MKLLLLSSLILASACGKYEITSSGSTIGERLSVTSLTSLDRSNLASICNALSSKNVAVNTTLNFESSESDCTGVSITKGLVPTTVQQSGSNFVLKRKTTGQDFIFPDLESASSGLLGDICQNLGSLENPVQTSTEQIIYSTTSSDISDCAPKAEELCVSVKRANLQNGEYIVHTKDLMRVKVADAGRTGKLGYFTFRKKITRSFCGLNEQLTFSAELK